MDSNSHSASSPSPEIGKTFSVPGYDSFYFFGTRDDKAVAVDHAQEANILAQHVALFVQRDSLYMDPQPAPPKMLDLFSRLFRLSDLLF